MRFARFEPIRYGKFSGAALEFPAGPTDFHLIYGPNEAGKSTLREAIAEFLFGISTRSPFNFRHDYGKMLLGAVAERDGELRELRRRKGNVNTLLDTAGSPVSDARLDDWLGGVDRDFYERMFALDHVRLRQGGEAILRDRDDVGAVLFEAAAGVGGLHRLRLALGGEAKALWAPNAKKSAYAEAHRRLREAKDELARAAVSAEKWRAAKERLGAAEAAHEQAARRGEAAEAERRRLERIRNVAPHLLLRRRASAELAEMGAVVALPADAAATLADAGQTIAIAESKALTALQEIQRVERDLAALRPDEGTLSAEGAIAELDQLAAVVRKERTDLPHRREDLADVARKLRELSGRLGWSADRDSLAERLPSAETREALPRLDKELGRLREAAEAARRAAASKRADLAAEESEAEDVRDLDVTPEWTEALAMAQGMGDLAAQRRVLESASTKARSDFEDALRALAPWSGDAEALRAPPSVSAETAQEWIARIAELDRKLERAGEAVGEREDALRRFELEREQLRRDRAPVTAEAVAVARARRDACWDRIREGEAAARQEYEALVREADALADRRFAGAEAANEWTRLGQEIERAESDVAARRADAGAIGAEREAVAAQWTGAAARWGAPGFRLSDYHPAWLAARQRALEKADALRDCETALAELDGRAAVARTALVEEWRRAAGEPDRADGDLAAWIRRTSDEHDRRKTARERRDNARERARRLRPEADAAEQAAGEAANRLDACEAKWRDALSAAGLPAGSSAERMSEALRLFVELEAEREKYRDLDSRIGKIERDIAAFESEAARLAEALAPEQAAAGGATIAAELRSRLERAKSDESRRLELEKELLGRQEELRAARGRREDAEARLAELRAAAGVEDLDALRQAVERSDRARTLRERIDAETEAAIRLGQRDPATLAAEFEAEDLDTLDARLAEAEERRKRAEAEREERLQERIHARRDLDEFGGGDAAAQAEARRQEALTDLSDIGARWARAKTGERLLEWAIHRFREERQGPLIGRASEIFAASTRGSFAALAVDSNEKGEPRLVGRRPRRADETDVESVGVDGLSDGTRDQLYLALRLAAVELHLRSAPALPFLADDLFVHWDDERAEAGFGALKELATRTQVLFLTHHRHLIDVARRAIGPDCPVVELGG